MDHSRNGSEHALENAEENIRNLCASNGWSAQNTLQAEVVQVTDVCSGRVRERERVAPEKPLEGHDTDRHNRQPD